MARTAKKQVSLSRSATRRVRRQQLIDATIEAIAKRGFADTTMADVATGAGLSQGIVNFHFRTKEELLVETLRDLNEEYRLTWRRALEAAGPDPANRLRAILAADFDPAVCSRKKIAVWHAFYGEAKARPTYQKICGDRDDERWEVMTGLIETLIAQGGYEGLEAMALSQILTAMTDGFWLDYHLSSSRIDRGAGCRAVGLMLAQLFPRHYPIEAQTAA